MQLSPAMGRAVGEGLKTYYKAKIEELEILARDRQHNLRRLEAQRNELNTKGAPAAPCSLTCVRQGETAGRRTARAVTQRRGRAGLMSVPAPVCAQQRTFNQLCNRQALRCDALPCSWPLTWSLRLRAVRLLREELQVLQEPGSYVGEVIKVRAALRARTRRRAQGRRWAVLTARRRAGDGQEQGAGEGAPGGQVCGGPGQVH